VPAMHRRRLQRCDARLRRGDRSLHGPQHRRAGRGGAHRPASSDGLRLHGGARHAACGGERALARRRLPGASQAPAGRRGVGVSWRATWPRNDEPHAARASPACA
jgi:hypothetical protein